MLQKYDLLVNIVSIMPANKISIDKAKTDKLFYFVANVVVYRESDGRCLILKRSKNEITHPGVWAVPGGKLEWSDLDITKPTRINGEVIDFEDTIIKLLQRELFEEAGIKMTNEIHFINDVAFIRPDNIPVVLVKFAAKYESGDVVIEEGSFTDSAWVNDAEIKNYKCIDGLDEEISITTKLFAN
jgi:ADP-ribose pyrophosphatase YjhB (NUDIX family)